jgi:hypothetical protein
MPSHGDDASSGRGHRRQRRPDGSPSLQPSETVHARIPPRALSIGLILKNAMSPPKLPLRHTPHPGVPSALSPCASGPHRSNYGCGPLGVPGVPAMEVVRRRISALAFRVRVDEMR